MTDECIMFFNDPGFNVMSYLNASLCAPITMRKWFVFGFSKEGAQYAADARSPRIQLSKSTPHFDSHITDIDFPSGEDSSVYPTYCSRNSSFLNPICGTHSEYQKKL